MPTVLALLAEGFEEIELVAPVDILRRAGIAVTVASVSGEIHATGRSGITLHADTNLDAVADREFDCLLLPGGPGVARLRSDNRVSALVRRFSAGGRTIAAICAAPTILADAGILEGRRFTAHPSVAGELPGIEVQSKVVADGKLLTSRGAGTAVEFGIALVGLLLSKERAEEIATSICMKI